jgi:hypothetical protein
MMFILSTRQVIYGTYYDGKQNVSTKLCNRNFVEVGIHEAITASSRASALLAIVGMISMLVDICNILIYESMTLIIIQ